MNRVAPWGTSPSAYREMVVQGLRERGEVRTMFAGQSMTPTLREGMQILLEEAEPAEIKPADIIMYKKADQAIVHRVVGIIRKNQKRIFVTKGDNHAYIDGDYIPEGDLIGRVRGAFFESDPQADVLIGSKFVGILYVALANLVSGVRRLRKYIPAPIRLIFKRFIGAFFFVFKEVIHSAYLGMYHGKLFYRRYAGRANSV